MAYTVVGTADPAHYHELHRDLVGSGESAAVCGVSKFRDAAHVWGVKTGLIKPAEGWTEPQKWGLDLEEGIGRRGARDLGCEIERGGVLLRSVEHPHLGATHDFRFTTGRYDRWLCEVKSFDFDESEVPDSIHVQVNHQMAVVDDAPGVVVVTFRGKWKAPGIYEVPREDDCVAWVVEKVEEFWGYVERREMPPASGLSSSREVLLALHPKRAEAKVVQLPLIAARWAARDEVLKEVIAKLETEREEARNRILQAIGDAMFGDVGEIRYKAQTVVKVAHTVKASKYIELRRVQA